MFTNNYCSFQIGKKQQHLLTLFFFEMFQLLVVQSALSRLEKTYRHEIAESHRRVAVTCDSGKVVIYVGVCEGVCEDKANTSAWDSWSHWGGDASCCSDTVITVTCDLDKVIMCMMGCEGGGGREWYVCKGVPLQIQGSWKTSISSCDI